MLAALSISEYAAKLSSKDAAPGGGSAAALSGLLGASLLEMVINLTLGRKEFAGHAVLLAEKQAALGRLHVDLKLLVDRDADAFNAVMDAYRLPKESEGEKQARLAAIQEALVQAAEVPLLTARYCLAVMEIAKELLGKVNEHAVSDLMIGALSCHAGVEGALLNTAINIPLIKDAALVAGYKEQVQSLKASADELIGVIRNGVYAEETFTIMQS